MNRLLEISKWLFSNSKGYRFKIILYTALDTFVSLLGIGMAILSKFLIDSATGGDKTAMIKWGISFVLLFLLELVLGTMEITYSTRLWQDVSIKMRLDLLEKLTQSYWLDYNRFHSGDLMTRLGNDAADIVDGLVENIPGICSLAVRFIAAFAVLLYFQPLLAIFAFVFAPAAFLISRLFGRKVRVLHLKIQETEGVYTGTLQEIFQNMFIIKAFGREKDSVGKAGALLADKKRLVMKRTALDAKVGVTKSIGEWIGYLLAFGAGIWGIFTKTTSFGTLTAFMQLFGHIQGPLSGLAGSIQQLVTTYASAERLMELDTVRGENYLQEKVELKYPPEIIFNRVSFSYKKDKPLFENLSFTLPAGKLTVIIGASGAGKTTIIRLILAMLQADSGSVLLNCGEGMGIPVSTATRKLMAYVPQGNTLFSGTIEENIRFGNPGASGLEIEKAARAACAWGFIMELEEGMQTVIGERGVGLSEGQAQRIAIARAFVRQAPVLILDEATSAVDMETERNILNNIKNFGSGKTCVAITHRESVLEMCDKTFEVRDGRIVEAEVSAGENTG